MAVPLTDCPLRVPAATFSCLHSMLSPAQDRTISFLASIFFLMAGVFLHFCFSPAAICIEGSEFSSTEQKDYLNSTTRFPSFPYYSCGQAENQPTQLTPACSVL